jgi:isoquinoline 1-oxidoreductase beta subunit
VSAVDRRVVIRCLAATGGALLMRASLEAEGALATGAPSRTAASAAEATRAAGSDPLPPEDALFDAYLRIAQDGATSIVVPAAELGQGVYTSLPMLVAEELDADWERVTVRLAAADPAFGNPARRGVQVTGGSDSVAGYHEMLRRLGASAREALVRVAAQDWGVTPAECRTERSAVHHAPSGRQLDYGRLAARAARLEPAQHPVLKSPRQFVLLGSRQRRKDTPPKCDGSARFGADLRLPGTLFGAVALAPIPGSTLASFDREAALRRRGVHALVEVDDGLGAVADDTWAAEQALRAAAPRFLAPAGRGESSARIAAALRVALDSPGVVADGAQGDPEAVLRRGTVALDAVYEVPLVAHACMEPMAATARVADGRCEVWAPSQRQGAAREAAAQACGLTVERVTLQGTFCGGGFGRKWEVDFVRHAVQLAAAVPGRPVAMTWSREADLRGDFFRAPFACRVRGALAADGGLAALHARIAGPSLLAFQRRPIAGADPSAAGNLILPQYAIGARRTEFVQRPIAQRIGFWRAVSLSQNGFFGESAIDELAHAAGEDGLAFRRRLLAHDARALAVLDRVAAAADWSTPLPRGRGRGVAFSTGFGSYHAQVAQVRLDGDLVRIERVTCVHDCGFAIDPDTVVAQMQGGIIFGLGALVQSVEVADGAAVPANFDAFPVPRLPQVPRIDVHLLDSGAPPGGVGEAGTAAILPAVANAVFAASGRRIRRLPIGLEGLELG